MGNHAEKARRRGKRAAKQALRDEDRTRYVFDVDGAKALAAAYRAQELYEDLGPDDSRLLFEATAEGYAWGVGPDADA